MKKPFFSVAIPTYNRAEDLRFAIQYLLNQTFQDFEIVISDNCSTDNTKEVISEFSSPKIKYFRNKTHTDVMPNVRKAIGRAKGEYVFLHGDDDFIFKRNALEKVWKIILKTKAGYVRLNYLSLSPDKKHIFDFRASKSYREDVRLSPGQKNIKVIDFLLKSDPSFLTGIFFKNSLPSLITNIDSELYSWFPIIFYSAEKYGAYYINEPLILAKWSQWRVKNDSSHPLFSLRSGKLTSEEYFEFVKDKMTRAEYEKFLTKHLTGVYVKNFPAIKLFTGGANTLRLTKRLLILEPNIKKNISFWINLGMALVMPRILLRIMRKLYLFLYIFRQNKDKDRLAVLKNKNMLQLASRSNK